MFRRSVSFLLACSLFYATWARAEEPVRSTQEELRRRNLYFGDIDGRRSGEYEEAVRRYQQRKGFAATGHEDPETLRSLGLLPRDPSEPPPKELEWPEEPVLKSDTRINVAQEAREVGLATGVAPESLAPAASSTVAPASHPARATPRASAAAQPSAERAEGPAVPIAAKDPQIVGPEKVLKLIRNYLHAMSGNHLEDELCLYADRVSYYNNGPVDRRLIEHQLRKYYAQWPKRSYDLAAISALSRKPKTGEISVTFKVNFSMKNERARVKGVTLNRIVLDAATSSPRIVAIQEHRVPN